jgi:hypothetical protein
MQPIKSISNWMSQSDYRDRWQQLKEYRETLKKYGQSNIKKQNRDKDGSRSAH